MFSRGVALNCVANGLIQREKILKIFGFNLQPDAGGSIDPRWQSGICT